MTDAGNRDATDRLITALRAEYLERFPGAGAEQDRAAGSLIHGGSHTLRLFDPAPFRVTEARGAHLKDSEGNTLLDLWQGHYANILGHNPPLVTGALAGRLAEGLGLQTGLCDESETAYAELLLGITGAERIRFTTSGTLATMYAVMLARGFTGRDRVVKAGGGWHGGHPYLLKGVGYHDGYDHADSAGLLPGEADSVLLTRYNDAGHLEDLLARQGDEVACVILEPWMGSGGFMGASPEYLRSVRDLTREHGVLLILDEIISGFRFCAGPVASLYGVEPDLTTMAKVIGGGMPLAAVAGRADVLGLVEPGVPGRVKFDGGTFSGHHLALLAGHTLVAWLTENADEVYPAIGAMGERFRRSAEAAFADEGIAARCTGDPNNAVPASSLGMIHFPTDPDAVLDHPEAVWDPARSDVRLREEGLKLALMLERVHVMHGMGAVSTVHTDEDLAWWEEAVRSAARRIAAGLKG